MQKSSETPPKCNLENERLPKLQKVVFLMILGLVLGGKSTRNASKSIAKIESKIHDLLVNMYHIWGVWDGPCYNRVAGGLKDLERF